MVAVVVAVVLVMYALLLFARFLSRLAGCVVLLLLLLLQLQLQLQ